MMCGGTGDVKEATEEIQQIVDSLKCEIQSKAGKEFETLKAVSYKSQVVAGTNYFIKVHVGNDDHVHVRVFQALPHTGAGPEVHSVQVGKTAEDSVEYF